MPWEGRVIIPVVLSRKEPLNSVISDLSVAGLFPGLVPEIPLLKILMCSIAQNVLSVFLSLGRT